MKQLGVKLCFAKNKKIFLKIVIILIAWMWSAVLPVHQFVRTEGCYGNK